jgi:hypothetical protein
VDDKDRRMYSAIFTMGESDVRTFADIMRQELKKEAPIPNMPEGFDEVMDGTPHKALAPVFTKQESGLVVIEHGWHTDDYIWHIGHSPKRKEWKVSQERMTYALAAIIDTVIPRTVRINIHPPIADWELKEYTIKALELKSVWSVPPSSITGLTEKFFKVLNSLI